MSGFKTFAVAGAGNIGQVIVKELLKLKREGSVSSVAVLTRAGGSQSHDLANDGAAFVEVDYDSPSSLSKALAGIDVVISTLPFHGLAAQGPLIDAAKAAGVKLFAPSEFGNPTEDAQDKPAFAGKNAARLRLKEIGLPYALFYNGPFPDFCLRPMLGFDFHNNKVSFGGSGEVPISWTSIPDVARFVVHVLTALPKEKVEWKSFRIEGDRKSFNEIVAEYEAQTGEKLTVTRKSRAELEAALKENPKDFISFLFLEWDLGGGVSGKPEQLDNGIWPEWKPSTAIENAIANAKAENA